MNALRILLLVVVGICAPAGSYAALSQTEARETFIRANELYRQQKYPEARALYERIAQSGLRSPEVEYNLANAAAREARIADAVLHYERARQLAPGDTDIAANLRRVAPIENDPEPSPAVRPFANLLTSYSASQWTVACLAMMLVFAIFAAVVISGPGRGVVRRLARFGAVICLGASILIAPFAILSRAHAQTLKVIVMKPETVVRSGPGTNYAVLATLAEGTKLKRSEFNEPGWAQVELRDGTRGFTLADNLQSI